MIVGFHPVAGNPIRMGFFSGWRTLNDLSARLGERIQKCYKAATERFLQALASQVTKPVP